MSVNVRKAGGPVDAFLKEREIRGTHPRKLFPMYDIIRDWVFDFENVEKEPDKDTSEYIKLTPEDEVEFLQTMSDYLNISAETGSIYVTFRESFYHHLVASWCTFVSESNLPDAFKIEMVLFCDKKLFYEYEEFQLGPFWFQIFQVESLKPMDLFLSHLDIFQIVDDFCIVVDKTRDENMLHFCTTLIKNRHDPERLNWLLSDMVLDGCRYHKDVFVKNFYLNGLQQYVDENELKDRICYTVDQMTRDLMYFLLINKHIECFRNNCAALCRAVLRSDCEDLCLFMLTDPRVQANLRSRPNALRQPHDDRPIADLPLFMAAYQTVVMRRGSRRAS